MELYLLRHGIAESVSTTGRDADRRLTPAGSAEARMMLKRAFGSGAQATLILSSPYRRAIETAEIAASASGYTGEILRANALTPDSSPEELWAEVRVFSDANSMLLVTHEPLVSDTLAWLLGVARVGRGFPTSGIACVNVEPGIAPRGTLRYMLTPDGLGRV